jgi:GSH-dependent disulfide-bond oxidoreductase
VNRTSSVTRASRLKDLTLYLWATPNSRRVTIILEELGLEYLTVPVDIRAGQQFGPEILALNPFGKIPVLTWHERGGKRVLYESGAILLALAERSGLLLPKPRVARESTLAWLMIALTALAPASGQAHHWHSLSKSANPGALLYAQAAVRRVYALLEQRLATQHFLSEAYSIADIAAFPWIERHSWTGISLGSYPHLLAWLERIAARPAVRRAMIQPAGISMD